jgi:hypothetical protein
MKMLLNTVLLGSLALVFSFGASAQIYRQDPYYNGRPGYGQMRSDVIQVVESHLQRAASHNRYFNNKEAQRFDNAMRHLSEFDSRLRRGQFDTRSLDRAIDDVNNVVRHNSLDYRERDILIGDLGRLRDFRATRGGYGYQGDRRDRRYDYDRDPYGYRR